MGEVLWTLLISQSKNRALCSQHDQSKPLNGKRLQSSPEALSQLLPAERVDKQAPSEDGPGTCFLSLQVSKQEVNSSETVLRIAGRKCCFLPLHSLCLLIVHHSAQPFASCLESPWQRPSFPICLRPNASHLTQHIPPFRSRHNMIRRRRHQLHPLPCSGSPEKLQTSGLMEIPTISWEEMGTETR